MPVALPLVQADFGITRADASLPYTLAMTGYAFGGFFRTARNHAERFTGPRPSRRIGQLSERLPAA
jgi:hypothetical protein